MKLIAAYPGPRPALSILLLTLAFILAPLSALIAEEPPSVLTLAEAYQLALRQSEALARNEEAVRRAEGIYKQTVSTLYPQISGIARERLNDERKFSTSADLDDIDDNNRGGSRQETDRFETGLRVTQLIFNGFRNWYLSEAAQSDIRAQEYVTERQKQLLYGDVAELFNQTLLYEADIKVLKGTEEVLKKRLGELSGWLELGKSKESEVLEAKSDLISVQAQVEQSAYLLAATKELLAFLTGRPAEEMNLVPAAPAFMLAPVESYLVSAEDRPDIKAARTRVEAEEKRLKAAYRDRWPRLDFEGNGYAYQSSDQQGDWDINILLSVPIFTGGRLDGQEQEAIAVLNSQKLSLQELERLKNRDIRVAHVNVKGAVEELERLKALITAAQKSLAAQRRDYELGIVNNLDVLRAIQGLQNAERRYIATDFQHRTNIARLKVAVGDLQ